MADSLSAAAAPAKTCRYRCQNGDWTLIGGTAPAGFHCAQFLGGCDQEGAEIMSAPVPDAPSSLVVDSNVGVYKFDSTNDTLYFTSGVADAGFQFFPTLTLEELRKQFPAVAAEVELLRNAKSLASLSVMVPAVPFAKG